MHNQTVLNVLKGMMLVGILLIILFKWQELIITHLVAPKTCKKKLFRTFVEVHVNIHTSSLLL